MLIDINCQFRAVPEIYYLHHFAIQSTTIGPGSERILVSQWIMLRKSSMCNHAQLLVSLARNCQAEVDYMQNGRCSLLSVPSCLVTLVKNSSSLETCTFAFLQWSQEYCATGICSDSYESYTLRETCTVIMLTNSPSLIAPSALVITHCLRLCWYLVRWAKCAVLPKNEDFLSACAFQGQSCRSAECKDATLPDITMTIQILTPKRK